MGEPAIMELIRKHYAAMPSRIRDGEEFRTNARSGSDYVVCLTRCRAGRLDTLVYSPSRGDTSNPRT